MQQIEGLRPAANMEAALPNVWSSGSQATLASTGTAHTLRSGISPYSLFVSILHVGLSSGSLYDCGTTNIVALKVATRLYLCATEHFAGVSSRCMSSRPVPGQVLISITHTDREDKVVDKNIDILL